VLLSRPGERKRQGPRHEGPAHGATGDAEARVSRERACHIERSRVDEPILRNRGRSALLDDDFQTSSRLPPMPIFDRKPRSQPPLPPHHGRPRNPHSPRLGSPNSKDSPFHVGVPLRPPSDVAESEDPSIFEPVGLFSERDEVPCPDQYVPPSRLPPDSEDVLPVPVPDEILDHRPRGSLSRQGARNPRVSTPPPPNPAARTNGRNRRPPTPC
jgi:hypothetical protein